MYSQEQCQPPIVALVVTGDSREELVGQLDNGKKSIDLQVPTFSLALGLAVPIMPRSAKLTIQTEIEDAKPLDQFGTLWEIKGRIRHQDIGVFPWLAPLTCFKGTYNTWSRRGSIGPA